MGDFFNSLLEAGARLGVYWEFRPGGRAADQLPRQIAKEIKALRGGCDRD